MCADVYPRLTKVFFPFPSRKDPHRSGCCQWVLPLCRVHHEAETRSFLGEVAVVAEREVGFSIMIEGKADC